MKPKPGSGLTRLCQPGDLYRMIKIPKKYLKRISPNLPASPAGWLAGVYGMTLAPNLFRSTDTGQHRPGHRVPVDRGDIGSGLNGGEITEIQVLVVIGEATDHLLYTSFTSLG